MLRHDLTWLWNHFLHWFTWNRISQCLGDSDSTLPPDSDNHLFIRIEEALIAIFSLACLQKRQLHTLLCLGWVKKSPQLRKNYKLLIGDINTDCVDNNWSLINLIQPTAFISKWNEKYQWKCSRLWPISNVCNVCFQRTCKTINCIMVNEKGFLSI